MNRKSFSGFLALLTAIAALAAPWTVQAQTTITEDFTTTSTTNPWWYFNGACLTAGAASTVGSEPTSGTGQLPGCAAIGIGGSGPLYYNENLVGGQNGVAGSTQTLPDPSGYGALRFTNGNPGGFHQNGAIVSTVPFSTGQGVAITFKTVTYRGNSGGGGSDGADGISFYLLDSTKLTTSTITGVSSGNGNGLGAWGGSLGYTCSNSNPPYNGLIGGYVAVGIDEYGNFLNGTSNTLSETGSSNTGGDNTASGGLYQPGRIGLRGAGSIAFNALTAAYGTNPGSSTLPYYPASLATSCLNAGGTYNPSAGVCESCSSGTYNSGTGLCEKCSGGATYNPTTNTCDSCASGTYDPTTNACEKCATGTYNAATNTCDSCATGTYDATTNNCQSCASGTYNAAANECETCAGGATYDATSNTCDSCATGTYDATTNMCETCASGAYDAAANTCESCASGTYDATLNKCETCASGTYNAATNKCEVCSGGDVWLSANNVCCPVGDTWNGTKCASGTGVLVTKGTLTTPAPTASNPNSPTASGPQSPTQVTPTASAPNSPTATTPNSPTGATPGTGSPDSIFAVQNTCSTGNLYNYSTANTPSNAGAASLTNTGNTAGILDYGAIPGAYVVLPSTTKIANESAMSRGAATPIFYQLTITQSGLLSLSYSLNSGSSYQPVITSQSITASNGPLPGNFLFGFAGSTGGSNNIHEILCFKAAPATTSASSAGASQRQSAKLETGAQAYFAYYNPDTWTGTVTASNLTTDGFGNIVIASTPNWDSGCVLSGIAAGASCATTGTSGYVAPTPAPTSRVILSWSGTQGISFEWNSLTQSPSGGQQAVLDAGDTTTSPGYTVQARLNYLRGDRTNEIQSNGSGLFRARSSVLADIVDSSPTWVGPPDASFPTTWTDRLNTTATAPENATTAQTYANYSSFNAQSGEMGNRQNVVYIGANDGLVHGFRSGSLTSSGAFQATAATPNDGQEVVAYMPGAVVQTIHSLNGDVDYSNAQYEHNFFVDATPGTGDLFYGSAWHSWLVGGLGPGGASIYALDVSNPANFTEGNASSLVIGEWTPSTINCTNVANCGNNMGDTYGTPQIRRLHDGKWGVIFGNGYGSTSGDAGIYVMTVDPTSGAQTFYYLSTGKGSATNPNGISYVAPADLDGDHVTDFVYAGDLLGNLWRFDLTSQTEASWTVSPGPLFTTQSGQPITTQVVVASGSPPGSTAQYVMLLFGTGQKIPLNQTSPATYATGTQTLYGVWDWNLSASDGGALGPGTGNPQGWNGVSGAQYASLTRVQSGLAAPYTLTVSNLQQQVVTIAGSTATNSGNRDITTNAVVCWAGTSTCTTGGNSQFGWYLNLPGTQEQVVFNPELVQQAFTVNSIVPANNSSTSCTLVADTGYTYAVNAMSGGAFTEVFLPSNDTNDSTLTGNPHYTDTNAIGIQTNATGSSFITGNGAGTMYLIYETNTVPTGSSAVGNGSLGLNLPTNTTAKPLSWIQRR